MITCEYCLHCDVCEWAFMPPKATQCDDFKHKGEWNKVVRCKDCVFYEPKYYPDGIRRMCCTNNKGIWTDTPPDEFCSYGEKRYEK